ncbi:MAG: Ni/Fe-hydrogenase cytochrome b subunit [Desulfobacterales bacterium]|jgi:Ni/Fe-hydrogenase subunit HybB-like protein|nr:Ni/Fe-hydrogenase cytochrome b subunit [Desulfobacteraceae bacterium]MBT4365395.1 Ni/Fe-hydrogenase cytochrome b subunit [Desulfobacteraceae bacterium]MBT7085238.1 Ni/Fe-hydrogenase cytochrome b subunit [Desulfobacterales bacterium]MBT7696355.1 Ni/Fe-hydrogenase cytochrome b subunit [Desulfobacterales bacterium]
MKSEKPLGGRIFTIPFTIFFIIALISLYFLGKRFVLGLGAVTNLNDGYPWGIWITYDVVVGTAFACGGYATALLIYVFNKREYHPLMKSAILTSLLGYTMSSVAVFLDVGRYWQLYNIFLPWYGNVNSVLFEVALCIAVYTFVLWFEFAPTILAKFNLEKLQAALNKIMFILIALGVLLPTMHQSSLGSLMIVAGHKLYPLWWSSFLPLLYLISAVMMGYAVVMVESSISTLRYKLPDETEILGKIAKVLALLAGIFLVLRICDIALRGHFELIFKGDLLGNIFIIENVLLIVPVCMLAIPSNRKKPRVLFLSALSMMFSGGLLRFNSYLVGFNPGNGWHYFPAAPEIIITLGIIAIEIMVYIWCIKRLPVFQKA